MSFQKTIKMKSINQLFKDAYWKLFNSFCPLKGPLSLFGYSSFPYTVDDQFLEIRDNLLDSLFHSDKLNTFLYGKPNGTPVHFYDILSTHPALISCLSISHVSAIRQYLGAKSYLDAVYLSVIKATDHSNAFSNSSGLYHHDSVGHRLKLFVPLNSFGNTLFPTKYLASSHKIKWQTYLNQNNGYGQRIPPSIVSNYDEHIINAPFGSLFIFDTNGIHRGNYNHSTENRVILQFEFSKHSINPFGEVGPSTFYLSPFSFDYLSKLSLLRLNLISSDGQICKHVGLPHRSYSSSFALLSDFI